MPYLRMFLGGQQMDEVYISEVLLQSILRDHIIEEEKQRMINLHAIAIRNSGMTPSFALDSVPSITNSFSPLGLKKDPS